jgi:hypothetical protein
VDAYYYLRTLAHGIYRANPEKNPSSKLDTAKVRQRRPSTKAPVPSLRKTITETSALALSWFNSSVNRLTISLEKNYLPDD